MSRASLKTGVLRSVVAGMALLLFTGFPFLDSTIEQTKRSVGRPPLPLVRTNSEEMRQLAEVYRTERRKRVEEGSSSPRLSVATIRFATQPLITINHPWTGTPILNANYTMSHPIERRLFCDNTVLAFNALYINSPDPTRAVCFFLDSRWNRIVFANKHEYWIKSYGEVHDPPRNEFYLAAPKGLTIDLSPNNAVYVANTEDGRILKLTYGVGYLGGEGSHAFTVPGISHPMDICIPNPAYGIPEGIWVADDWAGKLVEFTRPSGIQILSTVDQYSLGGQTHSVGRPRSIAADNFPWPRLAFVDGARNSLVVCDPSSISGTSALALSATEFTQAGSHLERVGVDATKNWWVADPGLGLVHTFDFDGNYLASFLPPAGVSMVSTSPCYLSGTNLYQPFEIFTAEPWSNTGGLRAYLPGADAVGLEIEETSSHFRLHSILTNACLLNVKVLRADNGNLVQTLYIGGSLATASSVDEVAKSSLPDGVYKFRVEVKPMFNHMYGADSLQWVVRESACFANVPINSPNNLTASSYPGNIRLSWDPVPYASSYRIYRNTQLINAGNGTSYWDRNLEPGQTYVYTVRAIFGTCEGPLTSPVSAQPLHLQSSTSSPTASNSQRKMTITTRLPGGLPTPPCERLLYESNGECWIAQKPLGETNWSPEYLLTDGTGTSSAPSIASWNERGAPGNTELYTVYRKVNGDYYDIYLKRELANGSWGAPVRLNDSSYASTYRPVLLSKNPHPVIARANNSVLAFWEGNDTLMVGILHELSGVWYFDGCFGWEQLSEGAINFRNPSVTVGHGEDNPGFVYQTFDDGRNIHLWSWLMPEYLWVDLGLVPASIGPKLFSTYAYSSQISGEETIGHEENHKVHVVWEAYGEYEPPPSTDAGTGWKYSSSPPNPRRVVYQGCTGIIGGVPQWTAASVFTNNNGSFYRPTITHLASGTLVMAWDDGSSTYRAVREPGNSWKVTEVYDDLINPNYLTGETDAGTLTTTRFVASSATGPLYTLAFGGEQTDAPQELAEVLGRRLTAATVPPTRRGRIQLRNNGADRIHVDVNRDGSTNISQADTTGFFGIELSGILLKKSDGSMQRLAFTPINDVTPGLTDLNAWEKLGSEQLTLPANADSIIILGASSLQNLSRIRGNGENSIRLAFDLVEANKDSVLKRLGNERVFERDSVHILSVRSRVAQFAGRQVIVRPKALGIALGRKDIAYTVVHVHNILTDSIGTKPLARNSMREEPTLPTIFALHQNYPNPFNPSTRINFDLPVPANVTLILYDVLGKEVATLTSGYREAGYHFATWNAVTASSGVYFARFTATDAVGQVKYQKMSKLLLLK